MQSSPRFKLTALHGDRRGAVLLLCLAIAATIVAAIPLRRAAAIRNHEETLTAETRKKHGPEFVPGEILVRFRAEMKAAELTATAAFVRSEAGREISVEFSRPQGFEIVGGLRLARVAAAETLEAVAALNARPDVLYAEPNYVRRKLATPNDPRFAEQWGLKNTGGGGGVAGADIRAEAAWDVTTGSRQTVVGVIDEGVDINHPDLQANIWTNPGETPGNNTDDDGNGFVDDVRGWDFFHNDATVFDGGPGDASTDAHGTHVAGIVGAVGNNSVGVAGVNWQVSLLPIKILGRDGEWPAPSSVLLTVRAYSYAKQMRELHASSGGARGANLRVLNNSYGGYGYSQAERDAIRALGEAGILFIAAAGNDGRTNDNNPAYPTNYDEPNVIAVAASDRSDSKTHFSNFGRRTVHLAAPGANILSTTPNGTYTFASGTSQAAPHVAGAAALLCAAHPDIPLARLRAALLFGGDFKPGLRPEDLFSGLITGRRLNAATSLQYAAETDTTAPDPAGAFRIASQQGRQVTLAWTAPGDDGAAGVASLYEIRYTDTDPRDSTQSSRSYALLAPLPAAAGTAQTATVNVPFRHTNGFISIRALDNVGNASAVAAVAVAVAAEDADPYVQSLAGPESLTTGGEPLNLRGDDKVLTYQLPFPLTFFGAPGQGVNVSTNGALYFGDPPRLNDGSFATDDAFSSADRLTGYRMIAGLWDDLRTDRRAGDDVYVVKPDPSRVIFRWQAVTYATPTGPTTTRGEHPVNFEIELRRDGTIIKRYGDGNTNLSPVVGLGGGDSDAYVVGSHTSELSLISLTNAQSVVYTPRRPTPPPMPDLVVSVRTTPDPAASGQQLTYEINVSNVNFNTPAEEVRLVTQIPEGTTFVSCTAPGRTCVGPPVGSVSGTLMVDIGRLFSGGGFPVAVTVQVTAPPGSTLTNTGTLSGYWPDPTPANNTFNISTPVVAAPRFDGVRTVAAGGDFNGGFTLAAKTDGTVWAWGYNTSGQLGDGTTSVGFNVPVQVHNLSAITSVAGGGSHSLALKSDGTIWGWGNNRDGQAGPPFPFEIIRPTPALVPNFAGVASIAAGYRHSMALKSDGTLWVWGGNNWGQLGNGTTQGATEPIQVDGLGAVKAMAAGAELSLAVKTDGTVWGWGRNTSGELGQPSHILSVKTPVRVGDITGVASVAAGDHLVLALKTDGTVWVSFGGNWQQVAGLGGVTKLSAALGHALALKSDGTVWAWGLNRSGQLGDGTTTERAAPVQVSGLAGAIDIGAGFEHSVAALSDGTVRAWGWNRSGELGDRTYLNRPSPVETNGPFPVATPTFSPDGGSFEQTQGVSVFCATQGAVIHYTTNGNDPTESDPVIQSGGTLFFRLTTTLKARAYKLGWPASAVKSAAYTFPEPQPTPTPTPVPGATSQPLAFVDSPNNGTSGAEIYLANLDGSNRVNLTNYQGDDFQPAWSPDGTKLAFVCLRTPYGAFSSNQRICVINADGTGFHVLTETSAEEYAPAWSPDGREIAFASHVPGFSSSLYVMNADGTSRRRVFDGQFVNSPDWSPDGLSLVFSMSGEIWTTRLNSGPSLRLTINSAQDIRPKWSPDGSKIVFASNRDGQFSAQYEIYVMNTNGGNTVRLTNNTFTDDYPDWSPDGSKLVYSSFDNNGQPSIYTMYGDGTGAARITSGSAATWRTAPAPPGGPHTIRLDSSTYVVNENAGRVAVQVMREGTTSGAASVFYTTGGNSSGACTQANGVASERCDYMHIQGTLDFAPGQTEAALSVPIIDDAHVEGSETFTLAISAPRGEGAMLGATTATTITINDDDASGGTANPADDARFFVRQHYLDFLSREPDQTGLDYWTNQATNCGNPDLLVCRINLSAAFFLSIEFQETGYLVYRMYKAAYGDLPGRPVPVRREEMFPDAQTIGRGVVVGLPGWQQQLNANKSGFAQSFVARQRFIDFYPQTLSPTEFVAQLNANTGGALTAAEAQALVQELTVANNSLQGRASVLRKVAENAEFNRREARKSFVLMQYFGYLRRNPDDIGFDGQPDPNFQGFNFWLSKLDQFNGNFIEAEMVRAFIESIEYRKRFGQ